MRFSTRSLTILVFLFSSSAFATPIDTLEMKKFINDFPAHYGVSKEEVTQILSKATFQQSIIDKMEKPAEKALMWDQYRNLFMREDRISAGIEFWDKNQETIRKVSETTGVDEKVIVGIIGVETFFGQRKGSYLVLDALYTLAFGYPKRSTFFKSELAEYIGISKTENLNIYQIKGSYAGAMGFCQFMPSSYRAYAVSYNEGSRDLVNEVDDAIASVANYLKEHRWKRGEPIAVEAYLTDNAEQLPDQKLKPSNSLSYYLNRGYEPMSRTISSDISATLTTFESQNGSKEYWFTTDNFYAITRYNHSPMYALVVFQLGEEIRSRRLGDQR